MQLTESQVRQLRRAARAEGVSLAEMVRRCVDRSLSDEGADQKWERALGAAGAFRDRSGAKDVSRRHDDYLDGAFDRP